VRLEAVRSTVTFQSWSCITHKVTHITLFQVKVTLWHLGLKTHGRQSTTKVSLTESTTTHCKLPSSAQFEMTVRHAVLTCKTQTVDTRFKTCCACTILIPLPPSVVPQLSST
jgi:hypothetical protein